MKKGYFCSEITYYQNTWRHLLVWNSNPRWCQQTWNHPSSLAISTKIILVYSRLFHELLQPIDYCLRRFKNYWNWYILRKKSLLFEVSHLSTYLVNGWNDFHQSRNEFWSELATAVTFFFSSKENSLFFQKITILFLWKVISQLETPIYDKLLLSLEEYVIVQCNESHVMSDY